MKYYYLIFIVKNNKKNSITCYIINIKMLIIFIIQHSSIVLFIFFFNFNWKKIPAKSIEILKAVSTSNLRLRIFAIFYYENLLLSFRLNLCEEMRKQNFP
jgi:hypothetical protein